MIQCQVFDAAVFNRHNLLYIGTVDNRENNAQRLSDDDRVSPDRTHVVGIDADSPRVTIRNRFPAGRAHARWAQPEGALSGWTT